MSHSHFSPTSPACFATSPSTYRHEVAAQVEAIQSAIQENDLSEVETWLLTARRRSICEASTKASRWNAVQSKPLRRVHKRLEQALLTADGIQSKEAASFDDLATLQQLHAQRPLDPYDAEMALHRALFEANFATAQWLLPMADRYFPLEAVQQGLLGLGTVKNSSSTWAQGKAMCHQLLVLAEEGSEHKEWCSLTPFAASSGDLTILQTLCRKVPGGRSNDNKRHLERAVSNGVRCQHADCVRWLIDVMKVDPTPVFEDKKRSGEFAEADYLATFVDRDLRKEWLKGFEQNDVFHRAKAMQAREDLIKTRVERAQVEPLLSPTDRGARSRQRP